MKIIRQVPSTAIQDVGIIENVQYNKAAGAKKSVEVGPHLLPLPGATPTTDATTAKMLCAGSSIAVYNRDTVLQSITFGEDATVASLAAGVCGAGHVGLPCAPGAWSYFSSAAQVSIIASSANLLVFLVDDDSYIRTEISQNS